MKWVVKVYVVGTQWEQLSEQLNEMLPMSTPNIYFCGEIKKILLIFCLSRARSPHGQTVNTNKLGINTS